MANIKNININYNLIEIIKNAGGDVSVDPLDTEPTFSVVGDTLYVTDISQDALDLAYLDYEAGYVPQEVLFNERVIGKQTIDFAAGRTREKYITTAPGQAEVYIMKSNEAELFVSLGYPGDTTNYPFIVAEAAATGKTLQQSADMILAKRDAWSVIGAAIEQERLSGKVNIDAASSQGAIDIIVTTTLEKLGEL